MHPGMLREEPAKAADIGHNPFPTNVDDGRGLELQFCLKIGCKGKINNVLEVF